MVRERNERKRRRTGRYVSNVNSALTLMTIPIGGRSAATGVARCSLTRRLENGATTQARLITYE